MQIVTIEMPDHEVLRQRAKEVSFPMDKNTKRFIHEFFDFFIHLKSPLGKPAGLAAPQVGMGLRIIILQIPPEAKEIRKDVYDIWPPTILINPTFSLTNNQNMNKDWEGCYSVPDKMGEVYRYDEINYKAFTIEGEEISGRAKGFLARLIQHEVGHLNGELYIDLLQVDTRYGSFEEMLVIRKQEREQVQV